MLHFGPHCVWYWASPAKPWVGTWFQMELCLVAFHGAEAWFEHLLIPIQQLLEGVSLELEDPTPVQPKSLEPIPAKQIRAIPFSHH